MLNLPPGATPQQFVAGFFLLTFGVACAINAAVWAGKSIRRRIGIIDQKRRVRVFNDMAAERIRNHFNGGK